MVAGNRLVGRADDLPFLGYSHYGPDPSAYDCRLRQTLESRMVFESRSSVLLFEPSPAELPFSFRPFNLSWCIVFCGGGLAPNNNEQPGSPA